MKTLILTLLLVIIPIASLLFVQYAMLFPQAVFSTHNYPWKEKQAHDKHYSFIHNIPLYYHDGGTEKALVVFFHGNNETIPMHIDTFDGLALLGYSVLLVEYPRYHGGHG